MASASLPARANWSDKLLWPTVEMGSSARLRRVNSIAFSTRPSVLARTAALLRIMGLSGARTSARWKISSRCGIVPLVVASPPKRELNTLRQSWDRSPAPSRPPRQRQSMRILEWQLTGNCLRSSRLHRANSTLGRNQGSISSARCNIIDCFFCSPHSCVVDKNANPQ